jgi:hypothetical protein
MSLAATKDVVVADVQGKAEVMSQGSSSWDPISFGMSLGTGDTIRTAKGSYVDLKFKGNGQDDAIVRVDSNSNMKITDYVASNDVANKKIALDLAMGDILVKANQLKNESQFQVRTPTSVVGVRGTGFKVSVSAEK